MPMTHPPKRLNLYPIFGEGSEGRTISKLSITKLKRFGFLKMPSVCRTPHSFPDGAGYMSHHSIRFPALLFQSQKDIIC